MTQHSTAVAHDVAELVRAAQDGDARALDALVAEHLQVVYNVIGRALNGGPDVDDLVQETVLRAIRSLPSLREPERFRSWLLTIAYRQVQLHLRSRATVLRRRRSLPVEVRDPRADFAERVVSELVLTGQRREVAEAVRWLDDADRGLLALWWQEAAGEVSRTDLAAALDVSPQHAGVRVQRMKAQLDLARGVVRAVRADPRCAQLTDRVRGWDGTADPLWRKRLIRHVRECARCGSHGHGLVSPERLLPGLAALPVPAPLAAAVQSALGTQAGHSLGVALQYKLLAATAAVAVLGGGFAFAIQETVDGPLNGPQSGLAAAPTVAVTATPGNNTAYRNGGTGFALPGTAAVVRANAAVANGPPATTAGTADLSRNSWQAGGWTAATFRSTDAATAEAPRAADGGLPETAYLTTGNGVGASMHG